MIIMPPSSSDNIYSLLALISNSKEAKKNLDAIVKATKEYEEIVKQASQAKIDSEAVLAKRTEAVAQAQAMDAALAAKQGELASKEAKLVQDINLFSNTKKDFETRVASKEQELDKAIASHNKAEQKAINAENAAKDLALKAEAKFKEYNDKLSTLKSLV